MKKAILVLAVLFISIITNAQTQIGQDIIAEANNDESGCSVSLSSDGSIVAIGADWNDGNGSNSGHVRIYKNISGIWTQIGQDIDGEAVDDHSGYSVSLSSDGSIVAIGSPENDGSSYANAGQVRIYKNISGTWTQIGQDIEGEAAGDKSGSSVSLSSDGSIVAIGAYGNDDNGSDAGQVRIYENISGIWTQIGQDINGEAADDESGQSVSLSSDGSIVAIGAYGNDDNGSDAGQVRIYENISGTWTQVGQDIDGEAADDYSGYSVSLSSDGSIVAIGAYQNDGNGSDAGHVRIYKNISGTWIQIGQDIDGEYADDYSGFPVSLSSDGSIVAIGAILNDNAGENAGQVRIYKNISGTWTQIGQDIYGEYAGDVLGWSVSLNFDGSIVAIGAPGYSSGAGEVKVFHSCDATYNNISEATCDTYTSPSGNYIWDTTGIYKDTIPSTSDCDSIITINLTILEPYQEQICMVTVDTLTGSNMVIWEKTSGMRTEKYRIYRESAVAGIYNLLNEQIYGDMSEYIDATANPMSQPYKYKITTVDSVCANESPIDSCEYHKTIHLQTSLGSPNGYQLSWTGYEGFPYLTYNIYGRETGVGSFLLVHQSAYGIDTWTDGTTAPSMEYRISVDKSDPCVSTSYAKTSGGPYNQSISNIDDYSTGINYNLSSLNKIYVYPNPCSGVFTVRGENISKIEITDVNGKTIFTQDKIVEFNNFDLTKEPKGIYLIKIISDGSVSIQKLIVN